MKKFIALATAVLVLIPASMALAAVVPCGQVDPVTNLVIECGGNGSPEMVTNGYGVTNSQVNHLKGGQTAHDAAGISMPCPFYITECLDISTTDVYQTQARFTAKQLQGFGWSLGQYTYWLTH